MRVKIKELQALAKKRSEELKALSDHFRQLNDFFAEVIKDNYIVDYNPPRFRRN